MAKTPRVKRANNPPPARPQPPHQGLRKRTVIISVLTLGAGAAIYGAVNGSDADGTVASSNKMFRSIAECERDSAVPREECVRQFQAAQAAHQKSAPHFQSKQVCESVYGEGKCETPASTTQSYFSPMMTAYLLGRSSRGAWQSAPLYQRRGDPPGQFRQMAPFPQPEPQRQGSSSSGSRSYSTSSYRTRTWSSRAGSTRVTSPSRSTSRGGFGRSSRGFSGS
ncbi:MAG: DUF1190 domain-containing protein [Beijerinckiaceae bacterium]